MTIEDLYQLDYERGPVDAPDRAADGSSDVWNEGGTMETFETEPPRWAE